MRSLGIDISKWQGKFVPQGNIDFVIIKVSEGMAVDPKFLDNLNAVMDVPYRGAYHYFRTAWDPIAQAEYFWDFAQLLFDFYAVDYEDYNNTLNAKGEKNLWKFYEKLSSLTDKPIYLYTTEYILRDTLVAYNKRWLDVPFWVARYNAGLDPQTAFPLFTGAIDNWGIWQYSSTGSGEEYGVDSNNIDLDVWNGLIQVEGEGEIDMKKWYASKTLWFSLLFIITAVAGLFGYADFTPSTQVAEWVQLGMGVLMAILRVYTSKGIEP